MKEKRIRVRNGGFGASKTQADQHKATFHHYLHQSRKPSLRPAVPPVFTGVFDDTMDIADTFEKVEQINNWYYDLPQQARSKITDPYSMYNYVQSATKEQLQELGLIAPTPPQPARSQLAGKAEVEQQSLDINRPTDTASKKAKNEDN